MKDATELEDQGLYKESFAKYVEAMHQNTTRKVTRDGMIRCSVKLTDEWLSDFLILKDNYGDASVLKLIKQIERHQKQLEYFGIKSTLNESNINELESYKKSTLSLWYTNAVRFIENGNYERAGDLFNRIIEIDENFKDAKSQIRIHLLYLNCNNHKSTTLVKLSLIHFIKAANRGCKKKKKPLEACFFFKSGKRKRPRLTTQTLR